MCNRLHACVFKHMYVCTYVCTTYKGIVRECGKDRLTRVGKGEPRMEQPKTQIYWHLGYRAWLQASQNQLFQPIFLSALSRLSRELVDPYLLPHSQALALRCPQPAVPHIL